MIKGKNKTPKGHINENDYFSTWFRVHFIQDYTLKSMRLKPEKWVKLVISDEQRRHLENFVYKGCPHTSPLTPLTPHLSLRFIRQIYRKS